MKDIVKKDELEKFRQRLLVRRRELTKDMNHLEDEALGDSASGDLSTIPFHMADLGTDTFDRDFALGLMENSAEELVALDEALARIRDGRYGMCDLCGEAIPRARLEAIPYTKHCVPCQQKQERRQP